MKRSVLCILLAAMLVLGLTACNKSGETAAPPAPASSADTPAPVTAPETEAPAKPVTELTTDAPTEPGTDTPTENPTEPVTEAPTEPVTEAPTEPSTEAQTEPATAEPSPEPYEEPTDYDSMLHFLVGVWNYFPVDEDAVDSPEIDGIPGLTIQLMEDGSFFAIRHADNAQCTGTWTLDWLYAYEDELPDWLCFQVDDADQGMEYIGDFWIENRAICAGTDRLDLVQVNNGDSVFLNSFDVFAETLVRGSYDPEARGSDPKLDAEFSGMVWEVRGNGTELWITEISPVDFSVTIGTQVAACYPVAADAELVWPTYIFNEGACPALVKTNADGEIVFLDWAEPEMEGN